MRTYIRSFATAVAVSIFCLSCAPAAEQAATAPVTEALANLEDWLGTGANREAWDRYLHLTELHDQVAKGDEADCATVDGVIEQLDSGANGLDLPRFRKLREALRAWSDELRVVQAPSLSDAALAADASFVPAPKEEAVQRKAALESALAKLEKHLTGDNGQRWREYLRLDSLHEQLQAETPDINTLATVERQFTADHAGLEMPIFADVGTALDRYISIVVARRDELKDQYVAQLQGLAKELKQYADDPSEDVAVQIGAKLGWLQRVRQAGGLVRAVRRRFSRPNLYVQASAGLVAAGIEQPVDDTSPVRDHILGTDITGTGHTVGHVSVELVPSENSAVIDILLSGQTKTETVGHNGPATIYSDGSVAISGSKRVVLDNAGFKSYPARGRAVARTRTRGIGARHRIVRRIASRRLAQQKAQAERIGSDHAGVRVRRRVEDQAGDQLSEAHSGYIDNIRNPLLRRREFPELLQFRTTKDALFVTGLHAGRMRLGAPSEPPTIDGDYDLVVRVHESMVNNMAAALLSGATLEEEEVQQKVIEWRGELPEQLESEPDRDPWAITFAASQPISVKFDDGGIEITMRGQRYTSGERDFRAMNITARYKAEIKDNGALLVRQGDLVVLPPNFVPGKSRLSSQQISWQTTLERRFGKVFEPEIESEGLELPGSWKKAGRLDLKILQSEAGWLALAWVASGEPLDSDEDAEGEDKVAVDKP